MFSKIWTSSVLILAICLQVNAHAAVAPAMGVEGDLIRADVQRPSAAHPCGSGVNIASEFDNSTAVAVDKTGSFKVNATCFNGGVDGSLKFTAKVDVTGTGTNFVPMNITTNGDDSPKAAESESLVASLPSGAKCTGGRSGNKCLVQFTSGSGFGNCVVVSQGTAGNSDAGNSDTGNSTTEHSTEHAATGTSTATDTAGGCSAKSDASKKADKMEKHVGAAATAPAGTRMARSLLAGLGDRRGLKEAMEVTREIRHARNFRFGLGAARRNSY